MRRALDFSGPALDNQAAAALAEALKEQILLERRLESTKIDLALKPDFSLADSFSFVDRVRRGRFDAHALREALHDLRLFSSLEEAQLLVSRFDIDGTVRFADYCYVMAPRSSEYASLLQGRSGLGGGLRSLSAETLEQLRLTWQTFLRVEIAAESLRQRLHRVGGFSAIAAFHCMDLDGTGRISKKELRSLLGEFGFIATEKELESLISRYDKDRDGRISYSEFAREITPHSPYRY